MRPIWVHWKFSRVPRTVRPWLYFSQNFYWALVSDRSCECAYKIWSLQLYPFGRSWDNTIIIGGSPKNLGSPWIRPRTLFSRFLMGCCSDGPVNVPAKFELPVCIFLVPDSLDRGNSSWSFGGGVANPNLGEEEAVDLWPWGSGMHTVRKSVGEFL